jgi:hypothetical protein
MSVAVATSVARTIALAPGAKETSLWMVKM